jgi:hypothetical protein
MTQETFGSPDKPLPHVPLTPEMRRATGIGNCLVIGQLVETNRGSIVAIGILGGTYLSSPPGPAPNHCHPATTAIQNDGVNELTSPLSLRS